MVYVPDFNPHEYMLPRMNSARSTAAGKPSADPATPVRGGRAQTARPLYGPREADFRASKHFVSGRSFPKSDPLNADYTPSDTGSMHKSIRKIVDGEHTGIVAKMSGGAPKVNSPAPPPARPLKAPASAAPDRSLEATAANVLARGAAPPPHRPAIPPNADLSSAPTPRSGGKAVHIPRPPSHEPVLQYRYSKGICPDDHSLVTARTVTPLNMPVEKQSFRSSFMASTSEYYANLHKGKSSNIF